MPARCSTVNIFGDERDQLGVAVGEALRDVPDTWCVIAEAVQAADRYTFTLTIDGRGEGSIAAAPSDLHTGEPPAHHDEGAWSRFRRAAGRVVQEFPAVGRFRARMATVRDQVARHAAVIDDGGLRISLVLPVDDPDRVSVIRALEAEGWRITDGEFPPRIVFEKRR